MFVSEALIFNELHKTGGSHIRRCLSHILKGELVGKHNTIPLDFHERFIIGSIRNPWDWYVSLWAFGCDGNGGLFDLTTNRTASWYYKTGLAREMGVSRLGLGRIWSQWYSDQKKDISLWQEAYSDSNDPEKFRLWLQLMSDNKRRFDLGEGYGFSTVCDAAGIMTFRFFKLYSNLGEALFEKNERISQREVEQYWEKHQIVDVFVRNEHLENDLIAALDKSGVSLDDDSKGFIHSQKSNKTNASNRNPASYYYDKSSIDIVRKMDPFLIDLFGYVEPE